MSRDEEMSIRAFQQRPFVVKKHDATRLHYDFRLEWNGVLLSWALPLGPSLRAGFPSEAIEMEDHRLANLSFEGLHETGPIMLWDRGTWTPDPGFEDVGNWMSRGLLQFTLRGEKLKGSWTLMRKGSCRNMLRPMWILLKDADPFARGPADICILKELPNSISTGRTLQEIVRDWRHPKRRGERQSELFQ